MWRTATPLRSSQPNGISTTPTSWRSTRSRPRSSGSSASAGGRWNGSSPDGKICSEVQYRATRLRGNGSVLICLLLVLGRERPRLLAASVRTPLPGPCHWTRLVVFAQVAPGAQPDRVRRTQLGARPARPPAVAAVAAAGSGDGRLAGSCRWAPRRPARRRRPAFVLREVSFVVPGPADRSRGLDLDRSPPVRRWPSSVRTAPARRRWRSCCAGCTTRVAARSRSTATICGRST